MEKIKIEKGTVSETLMLPLKGRVHCAEKYPDVFPDDEALRIVKNIDYDFDKLDYKEFVMITWGARNRELCERAKAYLKDHPKATIVNFGCGVDTIFSAIDNGTCHFMNLDLPEVIEAREKIIACRDREKNVAGDAFALDWIREIETPIEDGVYVISGGVFMFFDETKLRPLFDEMARRLPGGGVCFDGESSSAVKRSNKIVAKTGNKGALIKFAVNDVDETFRGWSDYFKTIITHDRMPQDIAKAKSIPLGARMMLKMGYRMGMIKFVEILFK